MSVIEMKTIVEIVFWLVSDSKRQFDSITLCDFPDSNFPNQVFPVIFHDQILLFYVHVFVGYNSSKNTIFIG